MGRISECGVQVTQVSIAAQQSTQNLVAKNNNLALFLMILYINWAQLSGACFECPYVVAVKWMLGLEPFEGLNWHVKNPLTWCAVVASCY